MSDYMQRTIGLKLCLSSAQAERLSELQSAFSAACNKAVLLAAQGKISNRIELHHAAYYAIRESAPALGAQMACNAVRQVATAYKALLSNRPELRDKEWPLVRFTSKGSVHFDKRTYSMWGDCLSLFTLQGRIKVNFQAGSFQRQYLDVGIPKEAELVRKPKGWFFNLVLDLPCPAPMPHRKTLGVNVGENNLAATSAGSLHGGGKLRHERDCFLNLRRRLQSNGSKSAKQHLKKVSGREARHVRHVNHEVSKAIVAEAIKNGYTEITLEELTNIRERLRTGKRMRSRLHRWAWAQLQGFIAYKAQAAGIRVAFVSPAYTSLTCAVCGNTGVRSRHRFSCRTCGRLAHADRNAALNIASLGSVSTVPTGAVNRPDVAAFTG